MEPLQFRQLMYLQSCCTLSNKNFFGCTCFSSCICYQGSSITTQWQIRSLMQKSVYSGCRAYESPPNHRGFAAGCVMGSRHLLWLSTRPAAPELQFRLPGKGEELGYRCVLTVTVRHRSRWNRFHKSLLTFPFKALGSKQADPERLRWASSTFSPKINEA